MSFLLSLFQIITFASSYVQWMNEHVIIPLKGNVYDYVEVPKAELYIDGKIVEDKAMYYERNGINRTFITTVVTSYVRTYTIYYKVNFPNYGISHTQAILFDIRDFEPPTILEIPTFKITLLQNLPNFTEGLRYKDNYDLVDKIKVYVNSSHIVKNRIGIYPIYYQIIDTSGNTMYAETTIEIYDHLPPDVTLKQEIILNYGELFTYTKYFSIKDNYDLFLHIEIDLSLVNFEKLGIYPIKLSATDQSGNETIVTTDLKIIDSVAPKIILKAHLKGIPVFEPVTHDLLKTFILNVSDNYDDLTIDDVYIFHDIDSSKLGSYTIYYHLFDLSYNATEVKLTIKVIDDKSPTIEIIKPFVFDVYDPLPHLIDHISVTDNYDPSHVLTVKITASPKMNVIGLYPITIEVKDLSSNVFIYRGYIEVIDNIPPTIEEISSIIITEFQKRPYFSYFNVSDNYSTKDKINITIDDQHVNYDTIGIYPIYVYACDESSNCQMLISEIIILDIESPRLTLTHDLWIAELHEPIIDLYQFIQQVTDNYDTLNQHDVIIEHHINISKIGVYRVTFMVVDSSLNKTTLHLMYKIDDSSKPDLIVIPLTLSYQETFYPLEGVTIKEHSTKVSLSIYPLSIDTQKPGTYTVTYIATDERGNSTKINRIVTVLAKEEKTNTSSYLPMAVVFILGTCATVYFWKKL